MSLRTYALPKIDPDFNSKEPWALDTLMIILNESTQELAHESAAILGVQAFLKMARLPYTVGVQSLNPTATHSSGRMPLLKSGPYVVSELESVVQLANSKGVTLTGSLSITEKAELRACMSLVHNVLEKALLHFSWLDDSVYHTRREVRMGSPYNFPLQVLLPGVTRRAAVAQSRVLNKWAEPSVEQVYEEVQSCLLTLSNG